jgi:fused signal recognition particle receptor
VHPNKDITTVGWFKRKKDAQKPAPDAALEEARDEAPRASPDAAPDVPPDTTLTVSPVEPAPDAAPDTAPAADSVTPDARGGVFSRLRQRLSKTRKNLSDGFGRILAGKRKIDAEVLEQIEELLITADVGVQTATELIERVTAAQAADADELQQVLRTEILSILTRPGPPAPATPAKPLVIMVVGVNGVGKTTTIGKLAARYSASGKSVLIAAADTFRAAAVDQLAIWAERAGADLVRHKDGSDPAAVAFDAVEAALSRGTDIVIVDTAGRLHTKTNLMEEIKKIKRSIAKRLPDAPHEILLILDATTGQNAVSQAQMFNETLAVTGLALTKLDGTAKGGIVIAICRAFDIPLRHIGIGESIEDLQDFDAERFVDALFAGG